MFDFKIRYKDVIKIKHLKKLMKKLRKIAKDNKIEFVHGKGKRKSQIQKSIETLESYISRLKMYNNHLFKMGTRNSYSKTDNDATFMRRMEISKTFVELRNENLYRITSYIGIEFRKNRSIQAEGAFAQINNNMGFRRFLSKGKINVLAECIILALACNINKLHKRIFNL